MKRLPLHLVAVAFGLALAGCAASGESSKQPSKQSAGQSTAFGASSQWRSADPTVVQRDVMNFADRFAGRMADTYDTLAAGAKTPAAQNAALERKIGNVSAAYVNASESSPVVGLIDMIVTVTLLRQASQEPWFADLYGADDAAKVVTILRAQEADIWNIGSRYLTDGQLAELRAAIDRWHRDHAGQRYVSTVRLADFPEAKTPPAAEKDADKGGGSVFSLLFIDPLAGLDPAMREVVRSRESAERMFFYAQRMPLLISWQGESASRRVLDLPRMQQFAGATTRLSDFADTTRQLTQILQRLPQTIAEERQKTVDIVSKKIAAERDAALRQTNDVIATQRDATIKELADAATVQRDAAVKQVADAVAAERKEIARIATQSVTSEREAIVAAWNASLQQQRQALMTDMETASSRTVNHLSGLAALIVSAAILLSALAVLFIRRRAPLLVPAVPVAPAAALAPAPTRSPAREREHGRDLDDGDGGDVKTSSITNADTATTPRTIEPD